MLKIRLQVVTKIPSIFDYKKMMEFYLYNLGHGYNVVETVRFIEGDLHTVVCTTNEFIRLTLTSLLTFININAPLCSQFDQVFYEIIHPMSLICRGGTELEYDINFFPLPSINTTGLTTFENLQITKILLAAVYLKPTLSTIQIDIFR